jgi:hypothetical protein
MKQSLQIFTLIFLLASCSTTNLLTYKYKRHYSESSWISRDTVKNLVQEICHSKPRVIDAGYCHSLSITFKDTSEAITRKILHLEKDTAIINCKYGILSVWFWDYGESGKSKISGEIEILRWSKHKIKLREDIRILDERLEKTYKLKGKRVFRQRRN